MPNSLLLLQMMPSIFTKHQVFFVQYKNMGFVADNIMFKVDIPAAERNSGVMNFDDTICLNNSLTHLPEAFQHMTWEPLNGSLVPSEFVRSPKSGCHRLVYVYVGGCVIRQIGTLDLASIGINRGRLVVSRAALASSDSLSLIQQQLFKAGPAVKIGSV